MCVRGACMIASAGVCVSVRMGFASLTACPFDALSVRMKSGPSETNIYLGVTDISQLPMVPCRLGTSSGVTVGSQEIGQGAVSLLGA